MCEINAYILNEDNEVPFLESVNSVRSEAGKVFLKNLFGEQKVFEGSIKEVSLVKNRIVLERR